MFFLHSVWPWKSEMRPRDSLVATSSPNLEIVVEHQEEKNPKLDFKEIKKYLKQILLGALGLVALGGAAVEPGADGVEDLEGGGVQPVGLGHHLGGEEEREKRRRSGGGEEEEERSTTLPLAVLKT